MVALKELYPDAKYMLIYTMDDANGTQLYYFADTYMELYHYMLTEYFDGDVDALNSCHDDMMGDDVWENDGERWEITYVEPCPKTKRETTLYEVSVPLFVCPYIKLYAHNETEAKNMAYEQMMEKIDSIFPKCDTRLLYDAEIDGGGWKAEVVLK